jgi:hypothetical protein
VSKDKSILESLAGLIPGYSAYQEQESRRDDDRRTRAFLAKRLGDVKARLNATGKQAVSAGDFELPASLEPIHSRVDLARNRLAAAVEGYASWFGERQVDVALLDEISRLDANLVSLVDQLDDLAKQLQASPKADTSELSQAAELLHARIDRREELLRGSL